MKKLICFVLLWIFLPVSVLAYNGDITVYVTNSGECYHIDGCTSLRKSAKAISLEEAVNEGYRPCKNCGAPSLSYDSDDSYEESEPEDPEDNYDSDWEYLPDYDLYYNSNSDMYYDPYSDTYIDPDEEVDSDWEYDVDHDLLYNPDMDMYIDPETSEYIDPKDVYDSDYDLDDDAGYSRAEQHDFPAEEKEPTIWSEYPVLIAIAFTMVVPLALAAYFVAVINALWKYKFRLIKPAFRQIEKHPGMSLFLFASLAAIIVYFSLGDCIVSEGEKIPMWANVFCFLAFIAVAFLPVMIFGDLDITESEKD